MTGTAIAIAIVLAIMWLMAAIAGRVNEAFEEELRLRGIQLGGGVVDEGDPSEPPVAGGTTSV